MIHFFFSIAAMGVAALGFVLVGEASSRNDDEPAGQDYIPSGKRDFENLGAE